MNTFIYLSRVFIIAAVVLLILALPSASWSAPQTLPNPQQLAFTCTNDSRPVSTEQELTAAQKNDAFAEVVVPAATFGGFSFGLAAPGFARSANKAILPVILKSIAGIESDWRQYETGQQIAKRGNTACDFGMMQLNENSSALLYTPTPSLLISTRGNIAAGAMSLRDKWDESSVRTAPIINDLDPQRLLNWYYAVGAYNSAPIPPNPTPTGPNPNGLWENNPTCNGTYSYCGPTDNFTGSRPWMTSSASRQQTVNWLSSDVNPLIFPYQERVLYNLQYPKRPVSVTDNWAVADLGLKQITAEGDYGIRPDDSLFRSGNNSTASNLLLFEHQAKLSRDRNGMLVATFEYNLPLAAQVVIEVVKITSVTTNGTSYEIVGVPLTLDIIGNKKRYLTAGAGCRTDWRRLWRPQAISITRSANLGLVLRKRSLTIRTRFTPARICSTAIRI